jgi:hypothetical protein
MYPLYLSPVDTDSAGSAAHSATWQVLMAATRNHTTSCRSSCQQETSYKLHH